jgi:hypothetical protein
MHAILRLTVFPSKYLATPNVIHRFFLMAGALDAGRKSIDETASALQQGFNNAK